jgi:hypothetical protein
MTEELAEALHAYIGAADIADDRKGYLFRTSRGHSATALSDKPMVQSDAWRMIRRRAAAAGINASIGNHSFRATGITAYLTTMAVRLSTRRRWRHSIRRGIAHRASRGQQPAGTAHRAGWRRRPLTGQRATVVAPRDRRRLHSGLGEAIPPIAWRCGGRRDWGRGSQTGRRRSAGSGDLPMTARILPYP